MLSFGGTFLLQTAFAQVFDSVLLRINSKADRTVKLPEFSLIHTTLSLFSESVADDAFNNFRWELTNNRFEVPAPFAKVSTKVPSWCRLRGRALNQSNKNGRRRISYSSSLRTLILLSILPKVVTRLFDRFKLLDHLPWDSTLIINRLIASTNTSPSTSFLPYFFPTLTLQCCTW